MKTIGVLSVFLALSLGCAGNFEGPGPDEGVPPPRAPTDPVKQQKFATPDAAVQAAMAACEKNDVKALLAMFGAENRDLLTTTDKASDKTGRAEIVAMYRQGQSLEPVGKAMNVLVIGEDAWPFPIPIVKNGKQWRWDTDAGREEIINRRIGRNEIETIKVCNAFVEGQSDYAARDWDDDQVQEYAQRFGSTAGKRDGLFWESKDGEPESPFGPLIADAGEYGKAKKKGDPWYGYHYRILFRQGANVPGGAYDYVINGNMIAGFAVLAYPSQYGVTGIMTFVVSHQGDVFERDLGVNTKRIAPGIESYNPDEKWRRSPRGE